MPILFACRAGDSARAEFGRADGDVDQLPEKEVHARKVNLFFSSEPNYIRRIIEVDRCRSISLITRFASCFELINRRITLDPRIPTPLNKVLVFSLGHLMAAGVN
jgi:hypothetical protein